MDSLTQIVLGAGTAEAAAGEKLGNRAMVWGAIGGTIPDLDIISNLWMSRLDSLAFHRGISHSILFCTVGALLMAWLVDLMYRRGWNRYLGPITLGIGSITLWTVINQNLFKGEISWIKLVVSSGLLLLAIWAILRRYYFSTPDKPDVSIGTWRKVFLWSMLTHPILDSFTAYGTQLFLPFSDVRVAFNNISVADPAYTIPFLICLIVAWFYKKNTTHRIRWTWAGIIISSLYMTFTFYNKYQVNQVYADTFAQKNISYNDYMTGPTILNNALWYGCAVSDDSLYYGLYSIFDQEPRAKLFSMPKNQQLLHEQKDDRTLRILRWFSNNFYSIIQKKDGSLQYNDMRYGTFSGKAMEEEDFIFSFGLKKDNQGYYQLDDEQRGPPENISPKEMIHQLWTRIKGI